MSVQLLHPARPEASRHSLFSKGFSPDFRAIVEGAGDSVIVTDPDLEAPGLTIRYVNPAFTRLTGYSPEQAVGRSLRILQGPGSDPAVLSRIAAALRRGEPGGGKVINYRRDGKPHWIDLRIVPLFGPAGDIRQFAAFQRDCTPDQSRLAEMRNLAERDMLTGVAHRRALLDMVQEHLMGEGVDELCFAHLDIDHFKSVNDLHGHAVGDAVLMGVADALSANLRRADLLGRLGGEEFGIGMPRIRLPEARMLAERLRQCVEATLFPTPAGPLAVTCSLGVTMARSGDTLSGLLARADQGLSAAKHGGRNRTALV